MAPWILLVHVLLYSWKVLPGLKVCPRDGGIFSTQWLPVQIFPATICVLILNVGYALGGLNPVHQKGQMAASADGYKERTWALVALSLLAQLPARVWQLLTVH